MFDALIISVKSNDTRMPTMSDESIYHLVPVTAEAPTKPARYRSRHSGLVSPGTVPCSALGVKATRTAATMGPGSGVVLVDPSKFLLAHEKDSVLPEPSKLTQQKKKKKDGVPRRGDKPIMGLQSGKNFVVENKTTASSTPPKIMQHRQINYLEKPWFGSVPPYLQKRMQEIEQQKLLAIKDEEDVFNKQKNANVVQTLQGDELEAIVKHLKLKWQTLNELYQKLPCVLDTPSKKRRKEDLEAQLSDLEQDINALQKAQVVHVTCD